VSSGVSYRFDPFELDPVRRRLSAGGAPVALSDRQLDILIALVSRAGHIIGKDELLDAAWKDVAVGDNSVEQAISSLRRVLAAHAGPVAYIETVARRGYRFAAAVARHARRESDAALEALLAPHRAFLEGRAALETLEADRIIAARGGFEQAVASVPDHAPAHLGLANACVMQFEMTRVDAQPDAAALARAAQHAREACRLDPESGEAWATLGFVLDRAGQHLDGLAAARRAVALEPDNWRHFLRLSYVSWGEDRLRAAHRTLSLLPQFPLAHWLAATVHVARQAFGEAERELAAAAAPRAGADARTWKFNAVGVQWLLGLLHLLRGDEARAEEAFARELASESAGQLYARECRANTWHAIGALRLSEDRRPEAREAFSRALALAEMHGLARVGLAAASVRRPSSRSSEPRPEDPARAVDAALAHAGRLALQGQPGEAARLVDAALAAAPPGSAGWILPIEPLIFTSRSPEAWAAALARLRNRAA
jgi:DNA-binding winged helix-turn-helix (wHTH) protein